jgi:hypothetical protein
MCSTTGVWFPNLDVHEVDEQQFEYARPKKFHAACAQPAGKVKALA